MKVLRRMGIALGSLVAASLCISLLGGILLGSIDSRMLATFAVILGALIYRDIVRREASPN